MGINPLIGWVPNEPSTSPDVDELASQLLAMSPDIVYFQKLHGPSVLAQVRRLRKAGVPSIFGVCDLVDDEMAEACDATVVVTDFLKSLYRQDLQTQIHVVHDAIERETEFATTCPQAASKHFLSAIMVSSKSVLALPVIGSPPADVHVTVIGAYEGVPRIAMRPQGLVWKRLPKDLRRVIPKRFQPIAEDYFRPVNWSPDGVYRRLSRADVGIIPVNTAPDKLPNRDVSWWQVKSENRLTLMMSMGLPVIATPIPSYERVIQNGVNGFFATTRSDWLKAFIKLRDPDLRRSVGIAARSTVVPRFSIEEQARALAQVLCLVYERSRHI